jgi:hypothetical protein
LAMIPMLPTLTAKVKSYVQNFKYYRADLPANVAKRSGFG